MRVSGPGGETVLVSVSRLPGASTPDVVARVRAAVADAVASFPAGVRVTPVYDQAALVDESMRSVRDAILLGIGLCVAVIALFLRDLRAGLVAALAVPLTLGITFLPLAIAGQSLNLMSMGGLAVAIGLVIDDAIVVVEAIRRRLEQGESAAQAAGAGARELLAALVGTTVTTVIVFVPLASLEGVVGRFFAALAITVSAAVLLSLAVAVTVVPLAAARLAGPAARSAARSALVRARLHARRAADAATPLAGRGRRAGAGRGGRRRRARGGHRFSADDGRGGVRPGLLPSGGDVADRNRRGRAPHRGRARRAARGRDLLAPHGRRAWSCGRHRGQPRRHHGAPQAGPGPPPHGRGGDRRGAGAAGPRGAGGARRVRAGAAGRPQRSLGRAAAHRGEAVRRRLRRPARAGDRDRARGSTTCPAWSISTRASRGTRPRSPSASTQRARRAWARPRPTSARIWTPACGASSRRPFAGRTVRSACACATPTPFASTAPRSRRCRS